MSDIPAERRPKLYGRRLGRPLRRHKSDLLADQLPRFRVDLPETGPEAGGPGAGGRIDPFALFPDLPRRPSAVWLEVGFGSGEHLADQAEAHSDIGLIGCEPFVNGVAGLLSHIEERDLKNVRIQPDDARPLIDALPDASIGRCFVLFSDPWPKVRHARRRFIGPENLPRLARILKDGAELRLASDDPGLVRWMFDHTWHHPDFEWLARGPDDWRHRPADWPPTRYEQKALDAGRKPVFLRFRRRPRTAA